jgi:competence ComEA-like helix-hairpin-helix protein
MKFNFSKTEKRIIILIAGLIILGGLSQFFEIRKFVTFKLANREDRAENQAYSYQSSKKNPAVQDSSGQPGMLPVSSKSPKKQQAIAVKFPINLNTATESQLIQIKGIGPVLAKAIVSYRDSLGLFKEVSHIIGVKGIGEKKLKKLSPFLCL